MTITGAKASSPLSQKSAPFTYDRLGSGDVDAMAGLQACAGDRIIYRDALFLKNHFAEGHLAFGAFDGPGLVGMALLTFERLEPPRLGRAFAGCARPTLDAAKVGTLVVAPAWRGAGVGHALLDACVATAVIHECDAAWARAQVGIGSVGLFLKHRFTVAATGDSPDRAPASAASVVHTLVRPLPRALPV